MAASVISPPGQNITAEMRTPFTWRPVPKKARSRCMVRMEISARRSGTSATQSGQALERIYRELAAIRTHYIMDAERSAMNWGAMHFGLEEHTPY